VLLVGFDPEHRTPVARGENAGRVLVEAEGTRVVAVVQIKVTVRGVEGVVHLQRVHSLQARLQIWEWGM
jgi:hypothetical protein